jgi:osmotically inducible lipoprotein OsmB
MQKTFGLASAAILTALVSFVPAYADGCSGHSHGTGTVVGAIGGGLIGSAMTHGSATGVIGGAVAGGFAGNAIARDIDCDRGRHYDRHARVYYYYDHHGHRIYEERVVRRDEHGHRYVETRYDRRD